MGQLVRHPVEELNRVLGKRLLGPEARNSTHAIQPAAPWVSTQDQCNTSACARYAISRPSNQGRHNNREYSSTIVCISKRRRDSSLSFAAEGFFCAQSSAAMMARESASGDSGGTRAICVADL